MTELLLLLALSAMWMSGPPPKYGPQPENLLIAYDGFVTMLLNGASPSLFRRENMKALGVEPLPPLDSENKETNENKNDKHMFLPY